MMSEGQVRELLTVLKASNAKEANVLRVAAFSGGMSALEMVLEEDQ